MNRLKKTFIPFVIVLCFIITAVSGVCTTSAEVISYGTKVKITKEGQVVDTITVNGVTVESLYTFRNSMNGPEDDPTYCCSAFISRFYKKVYGVTVWNLYPGDTPKVSSGSFTKTTSPQVGDIVGNNYHWAIVKAVNGDKITLIEQNFWGDNYTAACVNRVIRNDGEHWFFRWSGANASATPKLIIKYNANGAIIPGSDVTNDTYKVVTSDGLNMRSGAGTSNSIVQLLPKGTTFTVTETKTANGYTWGKTTYNSKSGWCVISKSGWASLIGSTPVTDYYLNNGMVYKSATSSCLEQSCTYGSAVGGVYGLWNYTSFGLVKEGYSFQGWSTSTSGSPLFDQDDASLMPEDIASKPSSGNVTVTLYAIWKSNEVSVTPTPTPTPTNTPTPNPTDDYMLGDVDKDTDVDANDALLVLQHAAKINILDELYAADVSFDGIADASDALLILQYAAKIITEF